MQYNPVGWFEIYVQDMSRSRKFYEGVLQQKLTELPMPPGEFDGMEMWSFPMDEKKTGAPGALVRMEGAPSGGNSTLVYFSCEDCSVEESRVQVQGGSVCKPKMSIGQYGFISIITDTEGNAIGLHSQK